MQIEGNTLKFIALVTHSQLTNFVQIHVDQNKFQM